MSLNPSQYLQKTVRAIVSDESIRWAVLAFVVLRLATGVAAVILVHRAPVDWPGWLSNNPDLQTYVQASPATTPLRNVLEPWLRYDTAWYIHNAMQGYRPGDPGIVFPPLYPITIRVLTPVCGNDYILAALLVSNLACLAAFILLFKLVLLEFNSQALARWTLLCLALFPTSYYLIAGYSESLFLALTLGAFFAGLKRHWWLAGLLAGLAALTRLQGALLCLPLGWLAYVHLRERGLRAVLARVPVIAGGPLGALIYMLYLSLNHLGQLDSVYEAKWQMFTRLPWVSVQTYIERLTSGQSAGFENNNALALALVLILGLVALRSLRPAYSIYIGSTLGMILLRHHVGPQFEGMARYTLVMFPCFIVAAKLISRRWWLLLPYSTAAVYWQLFLLNRFTHWLWVA